jgi:hypothetical protein
MSDKEFNDEQVRSFGEALSSLRPRADRLDPAWGAMLGKEVELNSLLRWQRPAVATDSAPLFGCGHERCTNGAGHWFVCVYCGSELPVASRVGRWGWPAALSVMTSIAAVLLVMLATQQQGQIVGHDVGADASRIATSARFDEDRNRPLDDARGQPATGRREAGGSNEVGVWPRLVATKQPDGREILSAGDMQRAVTFGSLGGFLTPN